MRLLRPSPALYVASLATVLAALIATGCAGSESDGRLTMDEYQVALAEVRDDYAATYQRVEATDFRDERRDQLFVVCGELAGIMDDLATRLQALSPPEELDASHAKLVDGFLGFKLFFLDFATRIDPSFVGPVKPDRLDDAQVEELVDEVFPGGKLDLSQVAAVGTVDDAFSELQAAHES